MTSQVIDPTPGSLQAAVVFNPGSRKETDMTAIAQSLPLRTRSLLRSALWFDAVSVAALGLLLLLPADALSPLLGLDATFMRTVGALLLPFAVFLALTAAQTRIPRLAVGWIVGLNALYVIASFAVLALSWLQPTVLGTAFVVAQALVGGAVAAVEWIGLRREPADGA
jgi:hypothetical protein